MRQLLLCFLLSTMTTLLWSQHELTGQVQDESQEALPGRLRLIGLKNPFN